MKSLLYILLSICSTELFFSQVHQSTDEAICNRIYSYAFEHKLIEKPMGEVVAQIASRFIGTPYEGNTLNPSDTERLVADLHSFDCVTLAENTLALARAVKANRMTFDEYRGQLERIRYRGGKLSGYASRLHYYSEWISDNGVKGVLKDITKDLGGREVKKPLNFMTTHRAAYAQLKNDSLFNAIGAIEAKLSQHSYYMIPKSRLRAIESKLHDGDIVAITTDIAGLDVSHTAFAVKGDDGRMHLLHAPDAGGVVEITKDPIGEYLQ